MRWIWLLAMISLVGCKTAPTEEELAAQKKHIDEYYALIELAEQYKLTLEKKYAEPRTLDVWIEMVHYKFSQTFKPSESMQGHKVKIRVTLDDEGNITSTSLVSSSGHPDLFKVANEAIRESAPFPVSGLTGKEKLTAKDVIFTFAPETNT
ncbi:TPA: energy transducer TonB [Vibrio harveyi]|uniref:TonB family protein n=1 Tax=Vibrio harveyi group TaxID=717610 RepID=UPI0015F3C605|nr:TonB family protein [Vibrio rotiferianus]EHR4996392.1 TonB family protein [Vibrio parahaemolyticus]EHR6686473.1 TonB family protein [Vibrio parahaemolyticus]EIV8488365.1 TonB family protein [Vibrio parahaemolyticus]ELM0326652.1 TonB family protein [Vibrio vulnificus]